MRTCKIKKRGFELKELIKRLESVDEQLRMLNAKLPSTQASPGLFEPIEPEAISVMSSTKIYNEVPIQTLVNNSAPNPVVSGDIPESAAKNGYFYGITTGYQSVVANGYLVIQLANPVGSGKSLYLARVTGGSTVNTIFDIVANGTFSAAGTTLTPLNSNLGFANSSVMTAKWITQGTDPTSGGVLYRSIVQNGGQIEVSYDGRHIVPPNNTMIFRMTNNTNQANPLTLNISWWEY